MFLANSRLHGEALKAINQMMFSRFHL